MADLTLARTTRQMTASGLAGLFGLFAGLCAMFAVCATLMDWHDETAQARWPVVSAAVERADVVASVRAPKDGGGTEWKLRYRVRYEQNGEALTATLTSRSVFSEAEATKLRSWAAQHRKGSRIDIRLDPSQANRAAFASAEVSPTAGRIRSDLILVAVAATACAGLLTLAKVLRTREARAAPSADGGQGSGLVFGLLFAAMGLMLTGVVIYGAVHADPTTADNLMGLPASLMFVFAGILIALPPQYTKWRNLLGTLVITCFALTFDWVAFGPGERRFTGSIGGIGFIPGEMMGRATFGIFAILLDVWSIAMWIRQCRNGFGANASDKQGSPTTSPAASTA
jgi:hypothetical protein